MYIYIYIYVYTSNIKRCYYCYSYAILMLILTLATILILMLTIITSSTIIVHFIIRYDMVWCDVILSALCTLHSCYNKTTSVSRYVVPFERKDSSTLPLVSPAWPGFAVRRLTYCCALLSCFVLCHGVVEAHKPLLSHCISNDTVVGSKTRKLVGLLRAQIIIAPFLTLRSPRKPSICLEITSPKTLNP